MNFTFFRGFGEFKTFQHIQLYLHTIVIDLFYLHAGICINKHTHTSIILQYVSSGNMYHISVCRNY